MLGKLLQGKGDPQINTSPFFYLHSFIPKSRGPNFWCLDLKLLQVNTRTISDTDTFVKILAVEMQTELVYIIKSWMDQGYNIIILDICCPKIIVCNYIDVPRIGGSWFLRNSLPGTRTSALDLIWCVSWVPGIGWGGDCFCMIHLTAWKVSL